MDLRRRCATHEAGHAVAALAYAIPISIANDMPHLHRGRYRAEANALPRRTRSETGVLRPHQRRQRPRRFIRQSHVQMMGVFAEFERAMIRERVLAGLAQAKEQGISLGRRQLENSDAAKAAAVKIALAAKKGVRRIARELQTGVGTVLRIQARPHSHRSCSRSCQPRLPRGRSVYAAGFATN
jgi:hypothetical protein